MYSKWILVAMIFVPYLVMAEETAPSSDPAAEVQEKPENASPKTEDASNKAAEATSSSVPATPAQQTEQVANESAVDATPVESAAQAVAEPTQAEMVSMVTQIDENEIVAAQNLEGVWVSTCYVERDSRFPNARSSGPVYAFSSHPLAFVSGTGYFSDSSCSNVEGVLVSQNTFLYDEVPTGVEYFNIAQPNIETIKDGSSYKVLALWGITPQRQLISWGRSASVEIHFDYHGDDELIRTQPDSGYMGNPQIYRRVTKQFPAIQQSQGKYLLVLKNPVATTHAEVVDEAR